jgi:hypothetical protein
VVKGGWSLRGSAAMGWWRVATGVTGRMQDSGTSTAICRGLQMRADRNN